MVVYLADEAVKSIARIFRIILAFQFYCCFIIITESFTLAQSMLTFLVSLAMATHIEHECVHCVTK